MDTIEMKYLELVNENFDSWIDPLSFPEFLRKHTDFDYAYSLKKGEDSGPATEALKDNYWKDSSRYLKEIVTLSFRGERQYLEYIPMLIKEVKRNGFNLAKEDSRRPRYQQELYTIYTRMSQQVSKYDMIWEDDNNELGQNNFQKATESVIRSTSTYWFEITDSLSSISIGITGIIYDLKDLLSKLKAVIDTNFIEDKIENNESTTDEKVALITNADNKPTNIFNSMPLDEVRSWFIQLAETNSRNGNPFLTAEQVGCFIDRAFCKGSFIEKLSINEKAGDKANIIGLFHLFYNYCITHQPGKGKLDPTATAEKYIRLLTDYFDNWTFEQIKHNFRNGGNWKRT